MVTDGDIDFTTYTRAQLDSAVTRMDHARYPINSRKLIDEYQRRKVEEKKAAAAATQESAALTVPDIMLSAPKAFAVTFEPGASFVRWLGPSRNDFHLVGSGSIAVDSAVVHLTGRRYQILVGLPVRDTNELGRQFVVNVESEGSVVRFELRVPGEKICGLTVWLRTAAEAEELAKLLPGGRTSDFTPKLASHVKFEQLLIAQSPKTPVTYAVLGICVFVYVGTALGTDHLFAFDGPSLVGLGSNFGPYTTEGDWWRLLTSMFLHAGIVHLAFNMWALASFGPLVERLHGSVSFALLYLVSGLMGSLASVTWNPAINSVGASGSIFGLLGGLIATQIRSDGSIPESVLRPLRISSLVFAGYALLAGFLSSEVDNAAHLGGIAAGFLLGLLLSRPITGVALSTGDSIRRLALAGMVSVLLLALGVSAAHYASKRLTGEGSYAATVHWFGQREVGVLRRWNELGALAKAGKWDGATYSNRIENEVIPFWREADARLAKVDVPITSGAYESLQFLRPVAHDRLHAYELVVRGLRQDDEKIAKDGLQELQQIKDRVEQAKTETAKK